jgi:hypothetical protein
MRAALPTLQSVTGEQGRHDRVTLSRRSIGLVAAGCAPVALFLLLTRGVVADPEWVVPSFHFFIVSLTCLVALLLAGLMVLAAGQLRDARVVFLSYAFLAISGIFAVHGLTTPGALFAGANPWVGFSARLSLLCGALFFALSTVDRNHGFRNWVVSRQKSLTLLFLLGLSVYAMVAFVDSARGGLAGPQPVAAASQATSDGYDDDRSYGSVGDAGGAHEHHGAGDTGRFGFLSGESVGRTTGLVTMLLFAVVIAHYARLYRTLAVSPLLVGFLASALMLFQAQVMMTFGEVWYGSWWLYHVLMLGAFVAASVGLVLEYSQSGSLQGVVEGLLVRDTISQLQRGYTEVIVALVGAVEAKDSYTRGHTQRVSELSLRIGQELRLPPDRLRVIGQAAMLHDIGKIGVPDSILNKPGRLTDAELAIIRHHPVRGYEIISHVRSLRAAIGGVRHHHERLDGSGYPDGLAGDAIPLEARIISVADVYDALTSERSYRAAMTSQQALAVVDAEAGRTLDADCVAALRRALAALDTSPAAGEATAHAVQQPFSALVGRPLLGSD